MTHTAEAAAKSCTVGLLVTCLVDLMRPSIGFAALKLLQDAGALVLVPEQTCCGQPAYNLGDRKDAAALARQVIDRFEGVDYVVVPSGSCAGMIKRHYPDLLTDDPAYGPRAEALAAKTYELTQFLVDVLKVERVSARFAGTAAYHDSCSSLREMGVSAAPRTLLKSVAGLTLVEMKDAEVCCGFGGTFSVKFPDISTAIGDAKIRAIEASGADHLLAADLGCLLHLAGRMARFGSPIEVRHVAEVLAGMTETAPIAAPA